MKSLEKRDRQEQVPSGVQATDSNRQVVSTVPAGERVNNTLKAYIEMRRRILSGEMVAGTQFLEQELAELLGMSRTPVREALIRLAEENLVEVRPRHGIRILPIAADDVRQCYELMIELEVFAARRVSEVGLRNEDYVAMSQAIAAMDAALDAGNMHAWAAADRMFHDCLYHATGNDRLIDIGKNLADQTQQARLKFLVARGPDRSIGLGHALLLETLRQQRPDDAASLKRTQMNASSQRVVEFIRRSELSA